MVEAGKSEASVQTSQPNLTRQQARRRLWRYYWDLISTLVMRDVQLKYRRSVLGIVWSVLNPLMMLIILSFIFEQVVPLGVANYPAYVFCGLIAWNWFSTSLLASNNLILGNADLVRKPYFATETLALINVGANMVNYILTLPVLFGLLLIDNLQLGWALLFLPLIMLVQFLLASGVSLLIAALNVYFRDIEHLTTIGVTLWFYVTPIFYRSDGVPKDLSWVFDFNPMAQIIRAYRQITLYNSPPDFAGLGWAAFLALLIGVIGFIFFRSVKHSFVEEI